MNFLQGHGRPAQGGRPERARGAEGTTPLPGGTPSWERGGAPRALRTRRLPSLTPGSLDWSMLTSAMLGRGPGRRSLPAFRPPPAPNAAPRAAAAAAAPAAAQSPTSSARARRRGRAAAQGLATKATGDGPRAPGWRPSCPAGATCSRAPGPDRYQIPGARKWTRAVQYGGREETERRAGGRTGLGGEGEGNCRSVTAIASGWRAKISSRGRLPAVSFVPCDAPKAGALLCPRPLGPASFPTEGHVFGWGLGVLKASTEGHTGHPECNRYCQRCSQYSVLWFWGYFHKMFTPCLPLTLFLEER